MKQRNLFFYTNLLAWGLVLLLAANYVFGWSTPSQNPPAGNITLSSSPWTTSGSDIYYNTGDVSIGTADSSNKLTVEGVSAGSGFSGSDGTGGVRVKWGTGYGIALDAWDGSVPRWGITKFSGATPLVMMEGRYNSTDVIFNAGNVGIGVTDPGGAKLKISGGVLDMTSQKITAVATPTADDDAATKAYVDAAGSSAYSECYYLSSMSNVSCADGYTTIVSSSGTGCGFTTDPYPNDSVILSFGSPVKVEYKLSTYGYRCSGSTHAGSQYECLRYYVLGTTVPEWSTISSRCRYSTSYYASTIAFCCK